jgi:hypothetical protein
MTVKDFIEAHKEIITREAVAAQEKGSTTIALWRTLKGLLFEKFREVNEETDITDFRAAVLEACGDMFKEVKDKPSAPEERDATEDVTEDIQKVLQINKYKLDEEAVSQPSYFYRYSEMLAEAKQMLAEREDFLKLTLAEKDSEVREGFRVSGVKFTEAVVANSVESLQEVQSARKQTRQAQGVVAKLSIAVQALDHKRDAIRNLTQLFVAGYFSTTGNGKPSDKVNENYSREIRKGLNS